MLGSGVKTHQKQTSLTPRRCCLSVRGSNSVSSGRPKQVDILALQVTFLCPFVEWVSLLITGATKLWPRASKMRDLELRPWLIFVLLLFLVCLCVFFESCRCICLSPNVILSSGSIKCPSSPRHPPDALLKVTAQHRRARSAAWSYRFPLNEEWCDLVISLPTAILLHEVHIQPHTTGLSSKCWPCFCSQGLCNKFV